MRVAVATDTLQIGEYEMVCHVLDDGTRVIEQQSIVSFLEWLESDLLTDEEVQRMVNWIHRKGEPT